MPKYRVRFSGEAIIEAPNVAKAAQLAKRVTVIGSAVGSRWDRHDTNYWRYETKTEGITMTLPQRILK